MSNNDNNTTSKTDHCRPCARTACKCAPKAGAEARDRGCCCGAACACGEGCACPGKCGC